MQIDRLQHNKNKWKRNKKKSEKLFIVHILRSTDSKKNFFFMFEFCHFFPFSGKIFSWSYSFVSTMKIVVQNKIWQVLQVWKAKDKKNERKIKIELEISTLKKHKEFMKL